MESNKHFMVSENVFCGGCDCVFDVKDQYAYHAGKYYCSSKCYDTLFLHCLNCDKENMSAKENKERHNEQLCMKCYDEKHGLSSVTIGFSETRFLGRQL